MKIKFFLGMLMLFLFTFTVISCGEDEEGGQKKRYNKLYLI